ncbi:MAG: hypothetical protein HQL96_13945 [Magnetococcales bacterium]|nr:hypothetical protein [Magnetococcales bacterium]
MNEFFPSLGATAKSLVKIATKPDRQSKEYEEWIQQQDFLEFLRAERQREEVILYAGLTHCYLYGIAVPAAAVTPIDVDDLLGWSCNPFSSWGLCHGYRDDSPELQMWIEPPLSSCGSRTLEHGEQLLFIRVFDGFLDNKTYVELSQKVAHLLGLHLVPERSAYCRLDENGDVEEVVRIHKRQDARVVTIKREDLDVLLLMLESSYILLFESIRYDPENIADWGDTPEENVSRSEEFLYFRCRASIDQSYMRGFQVTTPVINSRLRRRMMWESPDPKQYTTFIALDWKHRQVRECSCDPVQLGNYFVASDLPFETSPAFFRPEVLSRYKADPDKYRLEDRSISCRGAWFLQSYDINEAGQVHTYLCDLSHLPYAEQLYWKGFNENPKTGISGRAYKTDFMGKFDTSPDPLASLKRRLEALNGKRISWWNLKDPQQPDRVHYPVTDSREEWANELMALDQLVVEGLSRSYFKSKAVAAGIAIEPQCGSLRLISKVLLHAQVNEEEAAAVVTPLKSLHELRNIMKGHAGGSDANAKCKVLIAQYGDLRSHFRALANDCDQAIALMVEFTDAGLL